MFNYLLYIWKQLFVIYLDPVLALKELFMLDVLYRVEEIGVQKWCDVDVYVI